VDILKPTQRTFTGPLACSAKIATDGFSLRSSWSCRYASPVFYFLSSSRQINALRLMELLAHDLPISSATIPALSLAPNLFLGFLTPNIR
jgi:hypothetical protein